MTNRQVTVEAAFGKTPFDELTEYDWTLLVRTDNGLTRLKRPSSWNIGRDNELDSYPPGTADLMLWNRDRALDPDNPSSPYAVDPGKEAGGLYMDGTSGQGASTPDGLDTTNDVDIRAKLSMVDWTPGGFGKAIAAKWGTSQQSWLFGITATGEITFQTSPDGTTTLAHTSDTPTGITDGATAWVRATFDADSGAGTRIARFYTGTDGVNWVQLGAPVTVGATTSIFDSTSPIVVGDITVGGGLTVNGVIYTVQHGTSPNWAQPDFTNNAPGSTQFIDQWSRIWTIHGGEMHPEANGATFLQPLVPIRVRSQDVDTLTITDEFYGFVDDGWQQVLEPQGIGDCQLRLIDLLGVIGGYRLPGVLEHAIMVHDPVGYWPLTEGASNQQVTDLAGLTHGTVVEAPTSAPDLIAGLGQSMEFDGIADRIDISRSPLPFDTFHCTAIAVMSTTVPAEAFTSHPLFVMVDGTAGAFSKNVFVLYVETDGTIGFEYVQNSGGFDLVSTVRVDDGAPHVVFAQSNVGSGSDFGIGIDSATLESVLGLAYAHAGNGTAIAGTPMAKRGFDLNYFPGRLSHVAIIDAVLTEGERQVILDATTGLAGARSDVQISWALDRLGVPAALRNLDVGTVVMGAADTSGREAIDWLRDVAATEQGDLFVDHRDGGKVRFTNRYSRFTAARSVTSQATFSDSPVPDVVRSITFEDGLVGTWSASPGTVAADSTESAHSGTWSLRGTRTTAGSAIAFISQPAAAAWPVTPGQIIDIEAWAKHKNGASSNATMQIQFYLAGVFVSTVTASAVAAPNNTWTKFTQSTVAPAGVDGFRLLPSVAGVTTGNSAWLDDVLVTVSEPVDVILYPAGGLDIAPHGRDGIINQASVAWAGEHEVVHEDHDSVADFGPRPRTITTVATTAGQALSAGEWIVARYRSPRSRIRAATASRRTTNSRDDNVHALELGDRVTFEITPLHTGPETVVDLFVDGIDNHVAGTEWVTSFRFAPVDTFVPWIWGTSTWGETTVWG